jgi:hypothetical protein
MSKVEETVDSNSRTLQAKLSKKHKSIYSKMSNMRIIQKKLVYVIGLSSEIAFRDVHYSNLGSS